MADPDTTVFVVHGRSQAIRDDMFSFLRALGLRPLEWAHAIALTGSASPYIGDVLESAFEAARAVVVLLTPDDLAFLRPDLRNESDPEFEARPTGQARPNVLFEAGMAFGRRPEQTVLVEVGELRPFSDIGGRHAIRFDGSIARRQELANRLRDAGCTVDLRGTDWHTSGRFSTDPESKVAEPLPPPDLTSEGPAVTAAVRESGPDRFVVSVRNSGRIVAKKVSVIDIDESPFILLDPEPRTLEVGQQVSFTVASLSSRASQSLKNLRVTGEYDGGERFSLSLGAP